MRKAILHNRKDTNVRRPQHDLDAIPQLSELLESGECDHCGDCQDQGAVTDCELCPHGAPDTWQFYFPPESGLITGVSGLTTARELVHASGCLWQSDAIEIVCEEPETEEEEEGLSDNYGWELEITGRKPGDNTLTFSRLSENGCQDARLVYRNMFTWNCLCRNMFQISRDESQEVIFRNAPCSVCLRAPRISCGSWTGLGEVYSFTHISGLNPFCEDSYLLRWRNDYYCGACGVFAQAWSVEIPATGPPQCEFTLENERILTFCCESNLGAWRVFEFIKGCSFFSGCSCLLARTFLPVDDPFDPTVGGLYESLIGSETSVWELLPV